ncbi:hypothetical protein [Kutzneria sp. NPDC052558]|uniref:hypothetical protein n=1 Tax=Kutzneria sp. NPDC052558 TaxID=3364121 RepID=UPI0037C597E6
MLSRGSKGRLLVPLALVAVALTGVPVSATRQPAPPPDPPGQAQVVVTAGGGRLVHTTRDFWGNWQPADQTGPFGQIIGLTSTYHLGEDNVFFHTDEDGGRLAHLVRHNDGTWDTATAPPEQSKPTALAVTDLAGELAMVAVTDTRPALSIQEPDGTWSPWMAVPATGPVTEVAATADGTTLRVVAVAGGQTLDVRDRAADGRWTDVGHTDIHFHPSEISAAQVGDTLQFAAIDAGTIRHGQLIGPGAWVGPDSLDAPGYAVHVSVTAWLTGLQLVYTTREGRIQHSLRLSSGSWQPWGDVTRESGAPAAGAVAVAARTAF